MKVRIDHTKCQSHYVCNLIAPGIFSIVDDSDYPAVVEGNLTDEQAEEATRASLSCPERAIIVQ